jgi:hypothetical protein
VNVAVVRPAFAALRRGSLALASLERRLAGFAPALATLSTSCLFLLDYASDWRTALDPPAGAAPARFLYKRNPQAAAWRKLKSFSIFDWQEATRIAMRRPQIKNQK